MRILRWLAVGVLLLLVAAAGIWVVGSLLPVGHRATVSRTLPADAEVVWQRIDRVEAWPTWRNVRVEMLSGNSARVDDGWETLTYRIERPRARTLVTEIVTPGLPYGGRWTWAVTPSDGGTVVTVVEDGEVYDPFFRFFSRFVFGHDSTMRGVLDELEASFSEPAAVGGP